MQGEQGWSTSSEYGEQEWSTNYGKQEWEAGGMEH